MFGKPISCTVNPSVQSDAVAPAVEKKKVLVIGGGPAGMMAALAAAEKGHSVLLLEKNEKLGKKLYITGKGRCNVTNACEKDKFFENIVSNPKFLYSAFYDCDNANPSLDGICRQ